MNLNSPYNNFAKVFGHYEGRELQSFVYHDKETSPNHILSDEEIESLINLYETSNKIETQIRDGVNEEYRKVKKVELGVTEHRHLPIYDKICSAVFFTNGEFYKYHISGVIENFEILKYESDESSFYKKHIDYGAGNLYPRKLSVVVQLSHPDEYEGCDTLLYVQEQRDMLHKDKGCINIFPSFILHEVTPITKGVRYALVGWINGPDWC